MSRPAISLPDAVVAITGGARGIGRETAARFAAAGAPVGLGDIDGDAAASAAASIGAPAQPFGVDVRSRDSFADFIASVEETIGPIDVLVNNAGVMPAGPFLQEPETTTDLVLAVNLHGPIHGMRLVLPGMIERGRGHVVNVASMVGRVELAGLATYSASKHALVGLTSAVRAELHGTGVTLTTVLPGVVDTELSSGFAIPLTRLLRVGPQDVAEAIVASVHDRPHELAVPGWMGLVPYLRPWVPAPLETLVRRLLGGDSAMRPAGSARAAYTERLERQAAGD